ncbi:MAG: hypothetical protein JXL67_06225 [Calditrichaeota bacterium]|nr:hypothetical protein [Calditrichota bacterium]
MKKSIVIIIVIVAVVIVFFSFFWPLDKADDVKGTIGGVEKAKKFRGEQMDESDLLTENEDFVALTQSAEWQNAMKNKEVVKFLQSDEFTKFIILSADMQKFSFYTQCFQNLYTQVEKMTDPSPEKVHTLLRSEDFQKRILAQEFENIQPDYAIQELQKLIVLLDFPIIVAIVFSNDMNLVSSDEALKNLYKNDSFKIVFSQDFQKQFMSQDFQNAVSYSNDMQNMIELTSQDYLKGGEIYSQDFQSVIAYMSQDMQKIFMSQDFQKVFMSQDFQKVFMSQDFQKVFMSQEFQNYLKGGEFI